MPLIGVLGRGEIVIEGTDPADMVGIAPAFARLGVRMMYEGTSIRVPAGQELVVQDDLGGQIPKIEDGPWPNFPADLTSIAVAVATAIEQQAGIQPSS